MTGDFLIFFANLPLLFLLLAFTARLTYLLLAPTVSHQIAIIGSLISMFFPVGAGDAAFRWSSPAAEIRLYAVDPPLDGTLLLDLLPMRAPEAPDAVPRLYLNGEAQDLGLPIAAIRVTSQQDAGAPPNR